jgi:hypothetical protein
MSGKSHEAWFDPLTYLHTLMRQEDVSGRRVEAA